MAIGDLTAWTDQTPGLAVRMNKAGVVSGSGTYLDNLDLKQFKLLHCTSDGGPYVKDHIYLVKGDGTGVLDIGGIADHYHSSSGDGGSSIEIEMGMAEHIHGYSSMSHNLPIADWTQTVSGTGSTTEQTSSSEFTNNKTLKLLTGSTSGSGANLQIGGFKHYYGSESGWIALLKPGQTTDIATHWGFQMETITSSDDNNRKHGIVQCTSVNGNWFARTADGDSRSDSDTGEVVTTNVITALSWHIPAPADIGQTGSPRVNTWLDGDLALTKTNDIPTSSYGSVSNLWKFGVKNNVATNKDAYLFKLKMAYDGQGSYDWYGPSDMSQD